MSNTFFQWREKIFKKILVGFAPLVTGLIKTNKFSFSDMLWKEHICDRLRKVVPQLNKHDDVIEWKFMKIAPPPEVKSWLHPWFRPSYLSHDHFNQSCSIASPSRAFAWRGNIDTTQTIIRLTYKYRMLLKLVWFGTYKKQLSIFK